MSSSETLKPADFRGFGRGEGALGGLNHDEFASFCPPDVQPNTRIIAVCGPSDTKSYGSPQKDGWFFSDFYLFYHLLQDSPTFRSGNQLWLTCAEPKALVANYKEFVHGPRNGDRRVVLDASMLKTFEGAGNIRIIPSTELLQRFLYTLKDEINTAAKLNQPVLVLIFGHGDSDSHGVAIGGDFQPNAPRLFMGEFEKCLRKDVDVTLLITSCYSGGWVTKPRVRPFKPSQPFNISGMTASSAHEVSRSWALSKSIGRRAGGSIFATAVMKALMATSQRTPDFAQMCSAFDSVIQETEDGEPIRYEPTYVSLVKTVFESMRDLDPGLFEEHGISFAAKDDTWETAWRKRTGFPLVDYQSRWEMLRRFQSGPEVYLGIGDEEKLGGGPKFNILQERAFAYMKSYPGADNAGPNISLHSDLRALINGKDNFDVEILDYLDAVLDYRTSLLALASDYAQFADLNFGDPRKFHVESWFQKNFEEKKVDDLSISAKARNQFQKYRKVHQLIAEKKLFGVPLLATQGPDYEKPKKYLAIAFASSNLSLNEIQDVINKLHDLNNATQYLISTMPIAKSIMEDGRVSRARATVKKTLGRVGQRLRSLSPSKRY